MSTTLTIAQVKQDPKRKFRVKVHARGSHMWWTFSGATAKLSEAAVFCYDTVSPICRQPIEHPSVELVAYDEDGS
ncbi:hypothetical protein MYOV003v1_p0059 [Vibrio phage 207E48.1]|nr:hypothetical protein MYOV003v1_p0059 [Vibrio phage 207E48.1]